jgi:hypothetical protein
MRHPVADPPNLLHPGHEAGELLEPAPLVVGQPYRHFDLDGPFHVRGHLLLS